MWAGATLPLIPPIIESIKSREAPKTIVGFLVAIYGILMTASAAVAIGLATSNKSELVIYILIFAALATVALGVAVVVITWKDPSRLMLGQVTGREYAAIRYITQGDDTSGERVERILGPPVIEAPDTATQPRAQIEPPATEPPEPTAEDQT